MIKSINYWAFPGGWEEKLSPIDAISMAKEAGFEAIELAFGEGEFLSYNTNPKKIKEYSDHAKKVNIKISSLASVNYFKYPFASNDRKKVIKSKETVKKMIETANLLNIDAIMVIPGMVENLLYPEEAIIPYDIVYEKSLDALQELKKFAEDAKVYVCAENVWNKFLLSPLEFRDFIDKVNSPYVGIYFDVGNVLILGYPEHWIRILGNRIKRIHVKDFKKSIGTIDGFCDLLEGDVNFPEVIKSLKDINYKSFITADVMPAVEGLAIRTSKAMDKIFKL